MMMIQTITRDLCQGLFNPLLLPRSAISYHYDDGDDMIIINRSATMSTKRGDHRQVTLDRHQESLGIIGSLSGIIGSPSSMIGLSLGIIGASSGILGSSSGKLWEEERSDSPASDEDSSFWELYRYRCNALGIIGDHLVIIGDHWVTLGNIGYCWISLGIIGYHWVSLGIIG